MNRDTSQGICYVSSLAADSWSDSYSDSSDDDSEDEAALREATGQSIDLCGGQPNFSLVSTASASSGRLQSAHIPLAEGLLDTSLGRHLLLETA